MSGVFEQFAKEIEQEIGLSGIAVVHLMQPPAIEISVRRFYLDIFNHGHIHGLLFRIEFFKFYQRQLFSGFFVIIRSHDHKRCHDIGDHAIKDQDSDNDQRDQPFLPAFSVLLAFLHEPIIHKNASYRTAILSLSCIIRQTVSRQINGERRSYENWSGL